MPTYHRKDMDKSTVLEPGDVIVELDGRTTIVVPELPKMGVRPLRQDIKGPLTRSPRGWWPMA